MMVTASVKLVRPLGEGGMGSVWLAEHQALHTQVVVKFIASEYSGNAEALARFSREAAAASQVKSPHVVQTLDHGVTADKLPYIVMEYLEGHDLETHLTQVSTMTPRHVSEVVTQLARALEKAHSIGIVHRDIKPANIFLCDAGDGALFVKLLDFGIAKGANVGLMDSGTRTGAMIGSPFYMSPEQLVGAKDIDAKTDLWSVGVVAFEALTGRRAFDAETVGALALKIHNEPIPLPSQVNPELSSLDAWFSQACAKKPSERYASAKEMADSLSAAVNGEGRKTATSVAPSPMSRRSSDSIRRVENARTQVDPATDPRGRTDAGLGLQSNTSAPTSSGRGKGFTIAVAAITIPLLCIAAFGVVRLAGGGHTQAGPDPSSTAVGTSVHNASISQSAAQVTPSGSVADGTSSTAVIPSASASATPTSQSAAVASSKPNKGGAGAGAGGPAGAASQKPSHNPQGQASSTRKPGDDIY
jgi:serine/threonine-protein kinase